MIALFLKDTSALAPYWIMALSLVFLRILLLLFAPLGLLPPSADPGLGEDGVLFVMLVSFATGHGAASAEVTEGTIHLLDGLPIRRIHVFVSKVAAAMAPLAMMVAATPVIATLTVHPFLPPESASAWPLVAVEIGTLLPVAFGALGVGMTLSWLGGLGWGVFLLTWMFVAVASIPISGLRPFMPQPFGDLGAIVWNGAVPSTYASAGAVWWGLGALGIGLSGLLFLGPGERLLEAGSRMRGGIRIVAVGCGSFFWLSLTALLGLALAIQELSSLLAPVEREDIGEVRSLWRSEDHEEGRARLAEAIEMSAQVAGLLGTDPDLAFDLEMTGVARNHLGQTVPGKVRLGLGVDAYVLAHELGHVHAIAAMGDGVFEATESRDFFDEGLAEWIDRRLVPDPTPLSFAGAVARTGQARFDLLVDEKEHTTRSDLAQAYPLGEVFLDALVEVGGEHAPACVLEQIRVVRGLEGVAYWTALTDRCEIDLDRVLEVWWRRLDELAAPLPPLPILEAGVYRDEDDVWLEVRDRSASGEAWQLVCRFRQDAETPVSRYTHTPVVDGECTVPTSELSGAEFDAQVGFELGEDTVTLPWMTLPLR